MLIMTNGSRLFVSTDHQTGFVCSLSFRWPDVMPMLVSLLFEIKESARSL